MFNNIQIWGLGIDFIIYLFLIIPSLIICFNQKFFSTRKKFSLTLTSNIILTIFLSLIFYIFYENLFSLIPIQKGIINYVIYSGKIIFITSSLYPIKFLIPAYIFHNKSKKISILLAGAKIIDTLICMIIGYFIFNTKGILFAIPLSDLIYYIAYIFLYLKVFRNNI